MKNNSIEIIKYKFLMPDNIPISKASNTLINYDFGIPKAKEITTENNGVPFSISDINKLANIGISNNILFNCGLCYYQFDSAYCKSICGYPKNSILVQIRDNTCKYVLSLLDDNYFDFEIEGVDDIHWKYVNEEISFAKKKFRYEELFTSVIPKENLTGNNNGKWVKITNISSNYVCRLFPTYTSQESPSDDASLTTFFAVSSSNNRLELSPDDIEKNNYSDVYYNKHNYFTNYSLSNYTYGNASTSFSDFHLASINDIYISPYLYCAVWVKNVNYLTANTTLSIYGQQI